MNGKDVGGKYISARTWARRWDCSLSSVRRAAERHRVRRVYVGSGRNGLVRYAVEDIERLEDQSELCATVQAGA